MLTIAFTDPSFTSEEYNSLYYCANYGRLGFASFALDKNLSEYFGYNYPYLEHNCQLCQLNIWQALIKFRIIIKFDMIFVITLVQITKNDLINIIITYKINLSYS